MSDQKGPEMTRFHLYKTGAKDGVEVVSGTHRKTVLMSPYVQANISEKIKGSITPRHEHPQEMIGIFLRGRYRMGVGDKVYEFEPGDAVYIPGNMPHGPVEVISDEPGMMLDIIAPTRGEEKPLSERK